MNCFTDLKVLGQLQPVIWDYPDPFCESYLKNTGTDDKLSVVEISLHERLIGETVQKWRDGLQITIAKPEYAESEIIEDALNVAKGLVEVMESDNRDADNNPRIFVCKDPVRGKIQGVAAATFFGARIHEGKGLCRIEFLMTHPANLWNTSSKVKGVGTALLRFIASECLNSGLSKIILASTTSARGFYNRHQFEKVDSDIDSDDEVEEEDLVLEGHRLHHLAKGHLTKEEKARPPCETVSEGPFP